MAKKAPKAQAAPEGQAQAAPEGEAPAAPEGEAQAAPEGEAQAAPEGGAKHRDFDAPVYRVRSLSPGGRRRSGLAFGSEPIEVDSSMLSPRELDALLTDPLLVVEKQ